MVRSQALTVLVRISFDIYFKIQNFFSGADLHMQNFVFEFLEFELLEKILTPYFGGRLNPGFSVTSQRAGLF